MPEKGLKIGRYTGKVLGTYRSEAAAKEAAGKLSRTQRTYVMQIQRGKGWQLVDGADAGAPYLQRSNDYRGTSLSQTAMVDHVGDLFMHDIPPYNPLKSFADNQLAELLYDYGDNYFGGANSIQA